MIPSTVTHLLCQMDGTDYIFDFQVTQSTFKKKKKKKQTPQIILFYVQLRLLSDPSL